MELYNCLVFVKDVASSRDCFIYIKQLSRTEREVLSDEAANTIPVYSVQYGRVVP